MRSIILTVQKAILSGFILQTTKIKHGRGKCHVSVGKYQSAVRNKKQYAFIVSYRGGEEMVLSDSSREVTEAFNAFVGNDLAFKLAKSKLKTEPESPKRKGRRFSFMWENTAQDYIARLEQS